MIMIINKITAKKNKYELSFIENTLIIEVETLVRFNLRKGKELSKKELDEIILFNEKQIIYNTSLRYLKVRKTTLEFKKYLFNLEVEPKYIYELVEEFTKKGYLNDNLYTESFIKRYEKKYAKNRLEKLLLNKGISEEIINKYLINYKNIYLDEHLNHYLNITKKNNIISTKQAILRKMVSLGYDIKEVEDKLSLVKFNIDEKAALKKDFLKVYSKYKNKYEQYEVIFKVKKYLYNKGYSKTLIEEIIEEEVDEI